MTVFLLNVTLDRDLQLGMLLLQFNIPMSSEQCYIHTIVTKKTISHCRMHIAMCGMVLYNA